MNRLHPNELRSLQITAFALIAGPVMFLGIVLFLRAQETQRGDVEAAVYVAVLAAIASPMVAAFVRNEMTPGPSGVEPLPAAKARAAVIVPFAILEAAVFLCAIALLLTPTDWPLIAAAIPLGTMLRWFPRAS